MNTYKVVTIRNWKTTKHTVMAKSKAAVYGLFSDEILSIVKVLTPKQKHEIFVANREPKPTIQKLSDDQYEDLKREEMFHQLMEIHNVTL